MKRRRVMLRRNPLRRRKMVQLGSNSSDFQGYFQDLSLRDIFSRPSAEGEIEVTERFLGTDLEDVWRAHRPSEPLKRVVLAAKG